LPSVQEYAVKRNKGNQTFFRVSKFFDARQAHNMMAFMLDPHFKALCIVENLVGHKNAIRLTFEYDFKVVVPLLMVCFDWLNHVANTSVIASINVARPELEENMFEYGASIEESF
jgi:hypothetical protein